MKVGDTVYLKGQVEYQSLTVTGLVYADKVIQEDHPSGQRTLTVKEVTHAVVVWFSGGRLGEAKFPIEVLYSTEESEDDKAYAASINN
jgi:hypothetical protein